MAILTAARAEETETPQPRAPEPEASENGRWSLLDRLESTAIGRRLADGSVRVRRRERAGSILYGPYLHLPAGWYRLRFDCRTRAPRMTHQPVLGVEAIVLSRFQQGWADFTAGELASGGGSLVFEVPPEHSLESENEGRFEFRFFHLGNSDLAITAVDLERLPDEVAPDAVPRHWRLLGRVSKGWFGRRRHDGGITASGLAPATGILYGGWPYLRLPRGEYRLSLRGRAGTPSGPDDPVLAVELFAESRWRSDKPWRLLARLPEPGGRLHATGEFTARELGGGDASLEFTVPTELGIEAGADAPFDIRIRHLGNAAFNIDAVDLVRIGDAEPAAPAVAAPYLRPSGRRRIVIIGNCQCETLRQGFTRIEGLNRHFEAKYHFVQLPKNLHEFAARDLESCDILLVQDIRLWDEFPLRDCINPAAEVIRFPALRFASLWPFDTWNGPGDREAHDREAPNLIFDYLDGLLGRLRKEIPDKEARFQAYRTLEWPGIVNYRRLHQTEIRRLTNLDKQFGVAIGAFVLDNFQTRRVFHTTVRPNWQAFSLLMQYVAKCVGASDPVALTESYDVLLRNPQVPVHPKVAADLGVAWADERARYLNRGREVTWETYIRSYIDHYG
ncbi:MAG TPA: WcbI family polysaccharide biosynthesis putative acetyltransferase [Stellaceae bacterium]